MKKENTKKMIANIISKIGTKAAYNDNKQACAMFFYQPKCSEKLKKIMRNK